jgi:hypothetical protein
MPPPFHSAAAGVPTPTTTVVDASGKLLQSPHVHAPAPLPAVVGGNETSRVSGDGSFHSTHSTIQPTTAAAAASASAAANASAVAAAVTSSGVGSATSTSSLYPMPPVMMPTYQMPRYQDTTWQPQLFLPRSQPLKQDSLDATTTGPTGQTLNHEGGSSSSSNNNNSSSSSSSTSLPHQQSLALVPLRPMESLAHVSETLSGSSGGVQSQVIPLDGSDSTTVIPTDSRPPLPLPSHSSCHQGPVTSDAASSIGSITRPVNVDPAAAPAPSEPAV